MAEEVSEEFVQGLCKWFNKDKGYGFIKVPGEMFDIFIHANQLRKSGLDMPLAEGTPVKFVKAKGPKGAFATQISIVKD